MAMILSGRFIPCHAIAESADEIRAQGTPRRGEDGKARFHVSSEWPWCLGVYKRQPGMNGCDRRPTRLDSMRSTIVSSR